MPLPLNMRLSQGRFGAKPMPASRRTPVTVDGHKQSPNMSFSSGADGSDYSTTAAYFHYGLEAGVFDADEVRAWALAIVEARRTPPPEVVEVLASRTFLNLVEALKVVPGERDVRLAGRWLLNTLNRRLATDKSLVGVVTRQALQVAQSTGLEESIQFAFDGIADLFGLAQSGTYGTVENCHAELLTVLSSSEAPPALKLF